jgi:hypothetical protein
MLGAEFENVHHVIEVREHYEEVLREVFVNLDKVVRHSKQLLQPTPDPGNGDQLHGATNHRN